MPTNQFLAFASDGAVNVTSQVDYAASTVRKKGYATGAASSALMNKAARQGANMASAIGEAIINVTDLDASDNADIAALRDAVLALINTARVPRIAVFAASDPSWLVPAGVYSLRIRAWGAGGGGGGAQGGSAGGGGSGAYSEGIFTVSPGDDLSIVVPTGGAGGPSSGGSAAANDGVAGNTDVEVTNNTSTAAMIYAESGAGGKGTFTSGAGEGGVGGTILEAANLDIAGGRGSYGYTGSPAVGGQGADAPQGGGGGRTTGTAPTAGVFPGGGGAGGAGTQSGSAGAGGLVIIEY